MSIVLRLRNFLFLNQMDSVTIIFIILGFFFLSLWTCFLGRIDILKLKKKITLNVTECSAHMLSTCSPQMSILKLWSHCVCIWVCLIHSDETV